MNIITVRHLLTISQQRDQVILSSGVIKSRMVDNPPFQDKFQSARGAKILRFDWLVSKFGQRLNVRFDLRVFCTEVCQTDSLLYPQSVTVWNKFSTYILHIEYERL